MSTINVNLRGDGAFPELEAKHRAGQLIHLADDAVIGLAALAHGMDSGRASVAFRFDLPDGHSVLAESSLRNLWTATQLIAQKYGEPHMQQRIAPDVQRRRIEIALAHVTRQLLDAQRRLGDEPKLDLSAADAEYEAEIARSKE